MVALDGFEPSPAPSEGVYGFRDRWTNHYPRAQLFNKIDYTINQLSYLLFIFYGGRYGTRTRDKPACKAGAVAAVPIPQKLDAFYITVAFAISPRLTVLCKTAGLEPAYA